MDSQTDSIPETQAEVEFRTKQSVYKSYRQNMSSRTNEQRDVVLENLIAGELLNQGN